ncbi:MAG: hypothetical protein CML50_07555 [Rhodobacteraceae bacterium]|jgi:hypothetical protein|uniref:hypothetical protein n=1 Tax=Salipiger TaxID=263377 RepID=UPI0008EE1B61|nr:MULTISPECIES: hypothetical protein [Salipiger]MAB05855.1 hypothetical protein [Paracoccaceae bacterium]GGA10025.1 hypothetical protein GCM10011326_22220 [Salipiger profundus]SFC62541.1 hypothetical protein SAMN05444415_104164 [Salipiger profundus]
MTADQTLPARRCRIIVLMGSASDRLEEAVPRIARTVSERYGGLTTSFATGHWTPDGENASGPYDVSALMTERVLRLDLLVMPEQKAEALDLLQEACREVNRTLALGCVHLHIECLEAEAHHRLIA